jgi:hypothetical protein
MQAQKNQNLYQILYFLCIGVTYLNNYELTFAVWFVTIVLTVRKTYSITLIHYAVCFLSILIIASIVSIFRDNPLYNIIRDLTYLLKPILGLFAGYQLCKFDSKRALNLIVYSGLLISIIHLVIITLAFIEYKTLTVNLIRKAGGYFSDYEIYTLLILIFYKKFQLNISRSKIRIFILIVGLSSFLYLARTNFIQFFILFLGLKGYYKLNIRAIKVLLSTAIIVLVGYSIVLAINPKRGGKGLEAFLYKVKIAPIEPFKTKINKSDWKDFNDNYRSYENIIAVKQVSNNGMSAIIFGEGLGATLDLGRKVLSNDGEYVRHIPIVHNGYMTVFLKSGIVGVIILLYFLIILFRQRSSKISLNNQINNLLIGTSVFLILSNWVFLGLYLKLDNKSILIGYLICLKIIVQRENSILKLSNEDEKEY